MVRWINDLHVVVRGVSSTEFGDLEALCKGIMKDKQPFERLEISKETLLEMFKVNECSYVGSEFNRSWFMNIIRGERRPDWFSFHSITSLNAVS